MCVFLEALEIVIEGNIMEKIFQIIEMKAC